MTAPMVCVPVEPMPCPWCGFVGVDFVYPSTHRWLAPECQKCEARGPEVRIRTDAGTRDECVKATKPDAIAAWNTRAAAPAPQPVQGEAVMALCEACGGYGFTYEGEDGEQRVMCQACNGSGLPTPAVQIAAPGDVEQRIAALRAMLADEYSFDDGSSATFTLERAALDAAIAALRSQGQADAVVGRECSACCGKGWNDEWKKVSGHYMGGEAFQVECDCCEGTGQVSDGGKGETA